MFLFSGGEISKIMAMLRNPNSSNTAFNQNDENCFVKVEPIYEINDPRWSSSSKIVKMKTGITSDLHKCHMLAKSPIY